MGIAEKINGLNGTVLSRQALQSKIRLAKAEEQFHIAGKLQAFLDSYPNKKNFEIEIQNPQLDMVPESHLYCLDCQIAPEENEGLAKAVSPNEVYQMMTDKMINMVKEAKSKDYEKKWKQGTYGKGYTIPFNFESKKRYRGINIFLLTELELLENPYFLTFKQIEDNRGKLRQGSKAKPAVYFTQLFKISNTARNIDFGTYDKNKALAFASSNGFQPNDIETIPILKYYNVFNGKDIEGIDFDLDNFKIGFVERELPAEEKNRLPIAELIIDNYPAPRPAIKYGGDSAFYSPGKDIVQMPNLADFDTVQDFYRTMMHELSHSTGSSKRLARDFSGRYGSKKYAFEELVAEFGATFLSAEAGIIWHSNKNHAAYLKSWNSALTHLENDNKFLMKASTMAQKIADFVLQFDESGNPLYFKDLAKTVKAFEKDTDKEKPKKPAKKPAKKLPTKSGAKTKAAAKVAPEYDGKKATEEWQNRNHAIMDKITLEQRTQARKEWNSLKNRKIDWMDFLSDYADRIEKESKMPGSIELETETAVPEPPQKVDSKGQIALFGVKKEKLNGTAEAPLQDFAENCTPAENEVKKDPLIKTSSDLMNMQFDSLEFSDGWENFLQSPAKNMKIAVYGAPKNGKTSGFCDFASYLTKFGNILYNFADQGFNKSTQDIWKQAGLSDNPRAYSTDTRNLDDLEKLVASGNYDFVLIDMISTYIDRTGIKPHEFDERFIKKYPDVSFLLLFEVTKSGNFKGDQGWTHIVDAIVVVENFLMESRGRYGTGHYVVWKEGLQKHNPKKYDELYPDSEQASDFDPSEAENVKLSFTYKEN